MTEKEPWPYWMLRFVGSADESAMEDLIWSVGGSPPYGRVSYDEAAAVYQLLEDYRGPGVASADSYSRVRAFTAADPNRLAAIELFECVDEIQSDSENYGPAPVQRGLTLAREVGHRGAEAAFLAFESELHHRLGDLKAALDRTRQALDIFLEMADQDPAYEMRVRQTAHNAVSFTAMSGDINGARILLQKLIGLIDADAGEQLRQALDARRS